MPFSDLGNISLYYEEYGEGDTVLFLPELGGSTRSWRHVVASLSQHFHLLLPDVRGTGLSEKPRGTYTMAEIAQDILKFTLNKGVEKFHLVGCAMGSIVSLEIALQAPDQVRSLVLCSVSPEIPERTKLYAGERARKVRAHGMREVSRSSSFNSFPEGTAIPFDVARNEYEANFLANDPGAYAALSEALIAWEGGPKLSQIGCPCLCLAGDKDFMWDSDTVETAAKALPNAVFDIVPRAGHFPPLSSPEDFAYKTTAFLRSVGST